MSERNRHRLSLGTFRVASYGLLLVLVLGLLAACGGAQPAPGAAAPTSAPAAEATAAPAAEAPAAEATAAPAAEAPAAGQPVTVRWIIWADDIANDKNLQAEIKMYNDSQSEVKVELMGVPWNDFTPKLQALLAADQLPDVISIQNEAEFVSKGFLLPLDELIAKDLDANHFLPGALTPAYDGKNYGLRHDSAAWLLFYNKDLFDKAGLAYPPASGWTIDQFMDAACKLSKPEETMWGMKNLHWVMQFLTQSQNLPYFDMVNGVPTYQIDDPKTMAFYQKVGDFINKQNCQPNQDQNSSLGGSDPFLGGRAAMSLDGNWGFGNVKDNAQFNWDVAPIPGLKQPNFGMKIGLAKTGKNQEAAWKFLKWLTYDPEATRYRAEKGMGMPAINDEQAIKTFLTGPSTPASMSDVYKVITSPDNTLPIVDVPGLSEANNVLTPATDEVMNGLSQAPDVVPDAVKKANAILAEEWKKIGK